MPVEIGQIEAIFRYPVKSMAGERLDSAELGWHGIKGDRRLALRRVHDKSGFPWLNASKCPDLVRFRPFHREGGVDGELPTHVRTPEGEEMEVFGEELAADVERRHGAPVQMMHLRSGIFDEASVSIITDATIGETGRLSACGTDARRFRPNILVSLSNAIPFDEDNWIGGALQFGDPDDGPRVSLTKSDRRCSIVNIDPDSAQSNAEVLKAIVRGNDKIAGAYGTVVRTGRLAIGQTISLVGAAEVDRV